MKNISFLLLFYVAFLFQFCSKNTAITDSLLEPVDTIPVVSPTTIIEFGKTSFKVNGEFWPPTLIAKYFHSDSVFELRSAISEFPLRRTFSINDIPCKKGVYSLETHFYPNLRNQRPQSLSNFVYEEDQIIAVFHVDTNQVDNFIEVLNYNKRNKTVEGRFGFRMYESAHFNIGGVPDTLYITEGKFNVSILEE